MKEKKSVKMRRCYFHFYYSPFSFLCDGCAGVKMQVRINNGRALQRSKKLDGRDGRKGNSEVRLKGKVHILFS